jgi:RecA/RadA recombinase
LAKSKLFGNLRKKIQKKNEDIIIDLEEPKIWATSGNYVLNHILSGRFGRGYPAGRITQIFGDSGSGKSFLMAKAIADAQKEGYMVDCGLYWCFNFCKSTRQC